MVKENLSELIFSVTNRCNHRCEICYYHGPKAQVIKELDLDEIEKVCLSIGPLKRLWISGGEPFLRLDLVKICELFVRRNQIRHIIIPTNGSETDLIYSGVDWIMRNLPDVALTIMVTLDGRENIHDRIHAKPGAFQKTVHTVRRLNSLRLRLVKENHRFFALQLNTVVTEQTISEVLPLMAFVRNNLWVDLHSFTPLRGNPENTALKPPGGSALRLLAQEATPYFKYYCSRKYALKLEPERTLDLLDAQFQLWGNILEGRDPAFICRAGKSIGVLEPDGGVRLCELTAPVGNVRHNSYDFLKVWFSQEADRMRISMKGCSCTHACFITPPL